MKLRRWIFFVIFLAGAFEIYSILPPRPPQAGAARTFRMGALHVHSHFSSDGGGTIPEIAAGAKQAGFDFVVITDHDNIGAKRAGQEGTYDGVDMFVAMEASTPAGHLLTFFPSQLAENRTDQSLVDLSWSHLIGTGSAADLFVAVAHPTNLKRPWDRLDRIPEGVEIVNFDSAWQRQFYESSVGLSTTVALLPMNQFLAVARFTEIYKKDFVAWDSLNAMSTGHFGILGHDAHAKLILRKDLSVRWPDYGQGFRVASNLVFVPEPQSEDFEARRTALFQAIRQGRVAVAYQYLYPVEGADWLYECGTDGVARSGDTAKFADGCGFLVKLPPGFPYKTIVRLWKDGNLESETTAAGTAKLPATTPGVYRLEVWVELRTLTGFLLGGESPYLFYNPITLR